MNPAPLADDTFRLIMTFLIVGGASWALFDVVKMARTRGQDGKDPLVRDARFGYVMGIVIGLFAMSGLLRYHGVF